MDTFIRKEFGLSFGFMRIAFCITAIFFDIYILRSNINLAFSYFEYLIFSHIIVSIIILFAYKYHIFKFIFFILSLFSANYLLSFIEFPPVIIAILLVANLLILLFPLNNSLSIDKLLSSKPLTSTLIPKYYYILFFIIWGVFYMDAALYKLEDYSNWILHSDILFKKFFTAFPYLFNHNIFVEVLLENKFVNISMAILTVLYQLLFLLTIFLLKGKSKLYFLLFGISLHLSSALFLDLWYLALFTVIFYLPFIPNRYYYRFISFFRKKNKKLELIFDNQCMFCSKNILLIKLFDFNNRIKLNAQNLKNENEIVLLYDKKEYKGVGAFKKIFQTIPLYYPMYLLLSVPYIFKFFNKKYLAFAQNRANIVCKVPTSSISDYKNILLIFVGIYVLITLLTKVNYFFELKLRIAKIGMPIPATMFLVRNNQLIRTHYVYIKDKNNNSYFFNRMFWNNKTFLDEYQVQTIKRADELKQINTQNKNYYFRAFDSEDKYVNSYLHSAYLKLQKDNKSNIILRSISNKLNDEVFVCYKKSVITFKEIEKLSLKALDNKLLNNFKNAKENCLEIK